MSWATVAGGDGGRIRFATANRAYYGSNGNDDDLRRIFVSEDAGEHWSVFARTFLETTRFDFITVFAISPTDPLHLVVASKMGLWESRDLAPGIEWFAAGDPNPGVRTTAITFAPGSDRQVFVGYEDGKLFRTFDITVQTPQWTRIDNRAVTYTANTSTSQITASTGAPRWGTLPITSLVPTNFVDRDYVYVTLGGTAAGEKVYRLIDVKATGNLSTSFRPQISERFTVSG